MLVSPRRINRSELDLSGRRLGDAQVAALSAGLNTDRARNIVSNVELLDLSRNNIGIAGARALADKLLDNDVLLDLRLNANRIGAEGAVLLGKALISNCHIQRLSLGANDIGPTGATAIAHVLEQNAHLRRLELGMNAIGNAGAKALSDSLRSNRALEYLWLGSNKIDNDGAHHLIHAVKDNTHLLDVMVEDNQFNESTKRKVLFEVDKAVTRNRRGHTHPANPTPVDESNPHVQAARERQTKYVIRNAARKVEREGGSHSEL